MEKADRGLQEVAQGGVITDGGSHGIQLTEKAEGPQDGHLIDVSGRVAEPLVGGVLSCPHPRRNLTVSDTPPVLLASPSLI